MTCKLPVAIIGAGPVGLAAAAHLAARGEAFVVLESGACVGHSMLEWGHVRVFSPWRYNVDKVAGQLLQSTGWCHPTPDALPTGREVVEEYLTPLASLLARYGSVTAVGRLDLDKAASAGRDERPFALRVGSDGGEAFLLARAVIDASGTWRTPNPLGSGVRHSRCSWAAPERLCR
jgi:cation diffusion facilitator CzcD-associated flavoprotein CzcO